LLAAAAASAAAVLTTHWIGGSRVKQQTKVAIAVWDGVEELDFAGPYEVLAAWASFSERDIEVVTVAEDGAVVRCAHGLKVAPDTSWRELGRPDVLVLPGGASGVQLGDPGFLERLRSFAAGGTLMTSVCTGAVVFAAAGLLDGKPATTHWGSLEALAQYGKNVDVRPDDRFVDTGDVITSAGVSAGIDMALHLVKRLESEERAREVRRYIQYDPQPPV
jgi:transcriptional regulator GlxA family with amidase domain